MNIQQEIEQNLSDFYTSFKDENSFYENNYIKSIHKNWPNFILIKNYTKEFEELQNSIKNPLKIAKNWIFDTNYAKKQQKALKNKNLYPLKIWEGMYFNSAKKNKNKPLDNFKVEKLKVNELDSFIKIINESVFNKETLNKETFKSKIDNSDFNFFVGKYQNKIVSTCLIFDNNITNGLYFIATKKEFRAKGFGKSIVIEAINNQIKKGKENFVLHANKAGVSIYKNIGFKEYSKLSIFVKIK